MNRDTWYFAYGSNLSKEQMKCRIGYLPEFKRCSLKDWEFVFNKKSSKDGTLKANIMPADGEEVLGVIYLCSECDMKKLAGYEGRGYKDRPIIVNLEDGTQQDAITYVARAERTCDAGPVHPDYVQVITDGARDHGLPEEYIEGTMKAAAIAKDG